MRRFPWCISLVWTISALGCVEKGPADLGRTASALATPTSSGARGYTRSDGVHAVVFTSSSILSPVEFAEDPFGNGKVTALTDSQSSTPPWGYKRSDNIDAVVYLDTGSAVHQVARSGGTWMDSDLTNLAGVNAPPGRDEVFGYVRTDQINAIIYAGRFDNHIYEVAFVPGSPPWIVSDLTLSTMAPAVGRGTPVPYIRSDNRSAIVYAATDGHVHEILSNFSGSPAWRDTDLSIASQAMASGGMLGPWPYKRADNINAVVYVGTDAMLHQLAMDPNHGGTWSSSIIPTATNVDLFIRPSAYVRADGSSAVVYGVRGDIGDASATTALHEISLTPGGPWVDETLTVEPGLSPRSPFGHLAPGPRSSVLYVAIDIATPDRGAGIELSEASGTAAWDLESF